MILNLLRLASSIIAVGLLGAACGGGGSSSAPTAPPTRSEAFSAAASQVAATQLKLIAKDISFDKSSLEAAAGG